MVPGMRGAQSWAQGKGRRTVPSGTSQRKEGSAVSPNHIFNSHSPHRWAAGKSIHSCSPDCEHKGTEMSLVLGAPFQNMKIKETQMSVWINYCSQRHLHIGISPAWLLPHYRNEFHLLSVFQRLLSLGNWIKKKMTMLLFTLTGAKLALFETKPSRVTCSYFKALAHVALTSLQTLIDYSRSNLFSCFDEFSARRQTWMRHFRWLQGKTLF